MHRHHFRWAIPIVGFLVCALIFLSAARLLLVMWQLDRVENTNGFGYILAQGVRFDLVLLAQLLVIPVLIVPLLSLYEPSRRLVMVILRGYFLISATVLIFIECITPNFIGQYDFRPNILLVEYLAYPKEVVSMLIKAVPFQLTLAILTTTILVWFFSKFLKYLEGKTQASILWSSPLLIVLGLLLCVVASRSTFGHRPVNPSTVAFSSDPLVNSLPLSSAYSVAYALYEKIRHENNSIPPYGELSQEQVLQEIYDSIGLKANLFQNKEIPTLHKQPLSHVHPDIKGKNLVIILEESLGADFVGRLGGQDLTPNIDKLANEGIWFENLYATGTRSVRGIEAVVTGFLPTPARSVVKLGGSQTNFFTLAQLLLQQGYDTSFIYGGEAHFDNMKRFFSNNGFERIIEEKDYTNPVFTGSWGVSDEDLFNKAHETFSELASKQQPFFSLVFTSTNHSPFEFPNDRITHLGSPKNTVANAVKYADFALGEFILKAKTSDYWKDTVFLVIADHSDRVYGSELVPINKFRIPGLILGGDIKSQKIDRISSQIDMLPTLLSLMNVQTTHPAIGIDLTREDLDLIPGRAIMQFANTQAYMEEERVIVFQREKDPLQFTYQEKSLIPSTIDPELERRALAYSLWPQRAYKEKSYRLPQKHTNIIRQGDGTLIN